MVKKQARRKFLVTSMTAISIGVAGCSESNEDGDSNGNDGGTGGSQSTPSWQDVLDTRTDVQEDEYQGWSWSPDTSTEMKWQLTVRDGPEVELFMMESTEFDEYQAENRFYAIESESGTSGRSQFTVSGGNYRLVLDNTNMGDVVPPSNFNDDVADVELTVEARST